MRARLLEYDRRCGAFVDRVFDEADRIGGWPAIACAYVVLVALPGVIVVGFVVGVVDLMGRL